jgi:hypothetical protein
MESDNALILREPAAIVETATAAVAAQARAQIEARYVLAMRNPRDIDRARAKLMKACERPTFAEKAIYRLPRGQKFIEGPSIRFAEEAIRAMTNIYAPTMAIFDDADRRIVRVSVIDLEANVSYDKDVTIAKTIERKNPQKGATVIGQRLNSQGEQVFVIQATDDELLMKENALVSKALRTNGLRIVPSDIVEDALARARKTMTDRAAQDPEATRKKIMDGFAALGVDPAALKHYVGHDMARVTPEEYQALLSLHNAIRDGEVTWKEALESRMEARGEVVKPEPTVKDLVKEKAAAARGEKQS